MTSTEVDDSTSREYPCIIKATNGKMVRKPSSEGSSSTSSSTASKKIKISTLVQPSDYPSFSLAYGSLLKTTFVQTMRMKRKANKTRPSASAGAKSKGSTTVESSKSAMKRTRVQGVGSKERTLPKVTGAKRGAGHAARQARWQARVKAANKILANRRRKVALGKPMFPHLV